MRLCNFDTLLFYTILTTTIIDCVVVAELYSSVEELSKWTLSREKVLDLLEDQIKIEENRLHKLQFLKKIIADQAPQTYYSSSNHEYQLSHDTKFSKLFNPVEAFLTIHRVVRALEEVHLLYDEVDETSKLAQNDKTFINNIERMRLASVLPSYDDFIGCGKALVRLQVVYNLSIDDIALGNIHKPSSKNFDLDHKLVNLQMDSDDCRELGRIAYEDKLYSTSISWFEKSLELIENEKYLDGEPILYKDRKTEALEYMAFSAYIMGNIKRAKELTELWLKNDPDNERALNNLEYYVDELDQLDPNKNPTINRVEALAEEEIYSINTSTFSAQDYDIARDGTVSKLCRGIDQYTPSKYNCLINIPRRQNGLEPVVKTEILNKDPDIVRIHDIISESEAKQLKDLALPRLQRSTVFATTGLVTTEFRVGKTAWLSKSSVPVVDRIEQRVARILNLDMEGSENMQVVNYGFGGFYGPHLDSSRATRPDDDFSDSERIGELAKNDRLATVLIYLNGVEAGGATVFPRLNLTVEPVERSAVVWYNLLRNGLSDSRTLHAGCPVLLGSKWIATVWIRETANSFSRPCSLDRRE